MFFYNGHSCFLTRSWLYEVAGGNNPKPLYRTIGTVRDNNHVKGHIFAIEERPGFHERYPPEEVDRRFIVLLDMMKVWPRMFMKPAEVWLKKHRLSFVHMTRQGQWKGELG